MPLRHVVLGRFTDEATAEQKEAMLVAMHGMPSKIPEIRSLVSASTPARRATTR